jgi:hypothetical protein
VASAKSSFETGGSAIKTVSSAQAAAAASGLPPRVQEALGELVEAAKALRKVIRDVFGEGAPVQRCLRHKECHEDGHVRRRGQPRGRSRPRGVPSGSSRGSSWGSIGQRGVRGGVR